jgi:tetratricopeptide (TPR) repeat protein
MTAPQEVELARLLPSLQEGTKTGTLKIWGDSDRVKYIYFKRGIVELLKTRVSRTLLGKALLKRHKLSEDQLNAALERQKAASNSLRLGEILVGMGIVKESDVHQALAYQIAEEIFELFTWPTAYTEFFRGQPPLDIFEPEDLQARVSLSPIQLTREAIRRQNELQDIRRSIPSLKDVYSRTSKAYRAENETNPAISEVLSCLNAQRNVEELLDIVRAPDLVALRVLVKLVTDGDAVPLAAQELLALGQELEDRGQFESARDRYLRAEELGHPDFDLPRKIGQIGEALGDMPEACRRYMIYADRCSQAGYPDVAIQTLDRVLELDGSLHKARERRAELLAKLARALAESKSPEAPAKLAQATAEYELLLGFLTTAAEQRPILSELVALQPKRDDLREQMAMVSLELGDHAEAVIDLQELAMNALEAEELERAAGILEKILEIDSGDLMTLQSLAATYTKLGNPEGALRQYRRWVKSLEDSGLAAASRDTLVDIYEKIVELDPNDTAGRKFLAEAYEEKKHSDKAVGNYKKMVESLRATGGNDEELLEALTKLCELTPSDFDLVLERASLAQKLGKAADGSATMTLRSVAEAAQLQGDTASSQEAWTRLLAAEPGNLDGHLALAKLQVQNKEDEAAAKRCAAVFELALIAGSEDVAYEAVKLLLDAEPDVPAHRERLARIQVLRKREDEAARTLVRAARRARDDENFGLARSWSRRALELDATCDDARDLLENLKHVGANASAQPGPSPYQTGPTVKATITGGGRGTIIHSQVSSKSTKRVGGIADRLRNMKLGGPSAPRVSASEGRVISTKASSAMNKLRAMKGGGSSASQDALPADKKVSKGPEAPGDAADAAVSKKASSAMDRLRAMKSGGGSSKPPAGAATKKVSKGPEAPGEAAEAAVSKKASSAMDRLRAMKSGGGSSKPPAGAATKKVSKGPEAPGEAAEAAVSKKASSAMDRLRAMKSGGGGSKPPAGAATKKVSKGPEAPGEAADPGVSKKASSAMDRLRAMKSGGGGSSKPSAGAAATKVSKGPEAPGEAADAEVSKKASSAMDRLRALKAGGSSKPPAGASGTKVSKGPEAPGVAAEAGVSKKASSAMDRLRALRGGGGSSKPKASETKISKGPEAPGEAADAAVSKKASSAMDRLRALKAANKES